VSSTLTVDGLGVWDEAPSGLTNGHTVGLWTGAGTLLAYASVATGTLVDSTSTDGEWRFETISPVVLSPGSYVIGGTYLTSDPDLVRYFATATTRPEISFVTERECSGGCFGLTFPDSTSGIDDGVFGPNLRISDPDEIISGTVDSSGGTVSTGTTATSSDPVETSVSVPSGTAGGAVVISEEPIGETPPTGFSFLGKQVDISAPAGTVADPLALTFSVYAPGMAPGDVEVFKASVLVGACVGPGADPDPCVESRTAQGSDNVVIVVRTSTASPWNFGVLPEPGLLLQFAAGLLGLAVLDKRRRRAKGNA